MPSPVFSCMAQGWGVRFPCRPFSSEAARDAFPKPPSSRKATERVKYPLKPASGPYLPPDGGARSARRRNPTHRSHCTCRPKKNAVRPGGAQGAGETPTGTTGFPPAAGRQHPRVRRIPSVSINNVLLLRKNKRVRRMYLKPFSPRAGSGRGRKRERERESLTYQTNTSNADSFSLISYIYRKIPEPGPNRFYRLSSLVAYPFSYPFFASQLLFPQEYTVVIENKNFSEKISLFSDVFLFVLRTELLLTMCPTWSAGVFFIYGHVLLSSVPDALPRIRAPPLAAPYSGQMPEASPGAALAVMRDAHVLNSSPTRLKRTFH